MNADAFVYMGIMFFVFSLRGNQLGGERGFRGKRV